MRRPNTVGPAPPVRDIAMPRAFLKRKVIIIALAAATVIGAGIWGWRAWQRAKDYARVEVSTAVSWQHRDFGSNGPASEVTITLKTPFHCPYADAEVVIETWTDDRGTNLLIPVLRPGEERYTWLIAVHTADKGDSGNLPDPEIVPTPGSSVPTQVAWTPGSPVEVSPAASSMRDKGYVQFREGKRLQAVRVSGTDLSLLGC
jgi:hypothetical protein